MFPLHIITPGFYHAFSSLQLGSDGRYRICFKESDFQMHLFKMNSWFLVQICSLKFFKNSIREFKFAKPMNLLKLLGCGIMKHLDISRKHDKERVFAFESNGFFSKCQEIKHFPNQTKFVPVGKYR